MKGDRKLEGERTCVRGDRKLEGERTCVKGDRKLEGEETYEGYTSIYVRDSAAKR